MIALRLAMVGCEIAIVAAVIALLRRLELPEATVVAYAWHPLAVFEIANNGHVEALLVALMMLGVWLLVAARKVAGAVAVALAALVKPYAVLILPAFWRPWDWRVPLAVVAAILACYLPYLGAGWGVFGFLTAGYLAGRGTCERRGHLAGRARSGARSARCRGSRRSTSSSRPASWAGSPCASRPAPERSPRETVSDVDPAAHHRAVPDVAELPLVFPRTRSVHSARRRRADPRGWALTLGAFLLYRPIFLPHNELAVEDARHHPVPPCLAFAWRQREPWSSRMGELIETEKPVDPRRYFEAAPVAENGAAARPPVCLYLEVTNRCNLLCTTCPRTYVELEPPADMSWDLFRRIVDQVRTSSRAVMHGVGEPMLVKNLPKMVRYLKDRGVYVLFNTNGTVLNEKNGRALIDAGLDELRVSLDAANAASYLKVRGKDYFNRILKNVKAFRAMQEREGHAKPRVSAWLTGLKETVEELPAFVRIAAEIGVRGSLPAAPRVLRS